MVNRNRVICLTTLLFWATYAFGQAGSGLFSEKMTIDRHYEDFLSTFESELNKYPPPPGRSDRIAIITSYLPVQLGRHFEDGATMAWGISDPGMSDSAGIAQAAARARAIITLMLKSQLQGVIDDYFIESSGTQVETLAGRYREYLHMNASMDYHEGDFEVAEHLVNNLGEHLVLMQYIKSHRKSKNKKLSINARIEFMKIEFLNGNEFETNDRLELSIKESGRIHPAHHNYLSRKVNDLTEIDSDMDGKVLSLPDYRYIYRLPDPASSIREPQSGSGETLSFGLWNAYLHEIIKKILTLEDVQDALVKSVNDQYNFNMQGINNQFILDKMFGFQLRSLEFRNNELIVKLK